MTSAKKNKRTRRDASISFRAGNILLSLKFGLSTADSLSKADQKFHARQSSPLDLIAEALGVVMISETVLEDINQVSFCL